MGSIYIHIPFCRQKCLYCDFHSFAVSPSVYEDYTNALLSEIKNKQHLYQKETIQTIFFGGGTPSILPTFLLQKIMTALYQYYTVSKNAEITIEANPGTLSLSTLYDFKKIGFNRISIGLQCWQDELLARIGRIHNRNMFLENYYNARKAGFQNINIDMMFSLPDQTFSQWQQSLYSILALQPEHISVYSLIIEPDTPFFELYQQNKISLPEEETDRAMYHFAQKLLCENGYQQYEISNFAKKGYECQHNKVYWQIKHYLGFGLGAHSFLENKRFHNTYNLKKYLSSENTEMLDLESLTVSQLQSEFMFMGLRMMEGISDTEFQKRFGISLCSVYGKQITDLINKNLIEKKQNHYVLSRRGIDLSNTVFCEFL